MIENKEKQATFDKKIGDITTQSSVLFTAHTWVAEIINKYDVCSHSMYQFISRTMFLCASRVITEGLEFEEVFKQSVTDTMSMFYKFKNPLLIFVQAGLCDKTGNIIDNFLSEPVVVENLGSLNNRSTGQKKKE